MSPLRERPPNLTAGKGKGSPCTVGYRQYTRGAVDVTKRISHVRLAARGDLGRADDPCSVATRHQRIGLV